MIIRKFLLFLLTLGILFSQSQVVADVTELSISQRQLLSSNRVSRSETDFTYTITVDNTGEALTGIVATISSLSGNTIIQEAVVVFGSLAQGSTTSTDTFTLRQNRRVAFNPADLVYSFTTDDPANTSPVADAGEDQSVAIGSTVILDGSGSSDADHNALTYHWTLQGIPVGSTASLSSLTDPAASFFADLAGDYIATLIVSDGIENSLADSITISATDSPANHLPCQLDPRHLQLQTADLPAAGDAADNYNPVINGFVGQLLGLDLVESGNIEAFFTDLDSNAYGDLVLRIPNSNAVQVWLSDAQGILTTPRSYTIGSAPLTVLVVGNFIGDFKLDIAVAANDGQIDFLEGVGGGAFVLRNTLSLNAGNPVIRLSAADFDGDGDDDLLISTGISVSVFQQDNDLLNNKLIKNGDFSLGLSHWLTEVTGHQSGLQAGRVNVINGKALLREHNSFRSTLKQAYIIPDPAVNLVFDLLSEDLDDPQGGIPDAFEISLLDANSNSIVPTIGTGSTAFFNINPGSIYTLASGVSINGDRVTLDLSSATPGTAVTLYFDLIGNPPGTSSSATIDNVDAGTAITVINSFTGTDLPGPFIAPEGIGSCDADGDGLADILIHDTGSHELLIYGLDQSGQLLRKQIISLTVI